MKKVVLCFSVLACQVNARPLRVTLHNKSSEAIIVGLNANKSGCEKVLIKLRQSKLFPVQDITEMRPAILNIENGSGYWPQMYELKLLEPAELVLKRDSLVVSRKVLVPHQRVRRTHNQHAKRAAPAVTVKIAYYGKNGCGKNVIAGQEIGFL